MTVKESTHDRMTSPDSSISVMPIIHKKGGGSNDGV